MCTFTKHEAQQKTLKFKIKVKFLMFFLNVDDKIKKNFQKYYGINLSFCVGYKTF